MIMSVTLDALRQLVVNMNDAEIIERQTGQGHPVTLLFIRTLIDQERLNEAVIGPLNGRSHDTIIGSLAAPRDAKITALNEARKHLLQGSVLIHDGIRDEWWAVPLPNPLARSIETSETETIIFGPKDSFSEQLEQNITLIRRRLPLAALKTETYTLGSLSQTTVVLMYIDGLTNPEFISIARNKITAIDFDLFLDSSHIAAFMEDQNHSLYPQFMQTDRPIPARIRLGWVNLYCW